MINIIAAIQEGDLGLGFKNKLLFRLKDDLKNFKTLTLGQVIIMGRKTYDSIGQPLSDRVNIVITKNQNFRAAEHVIICHSLKDALSEAKKYNKEIFIIGGGEIYKEAIPKADRLYLTIIEGNEKADTFFPDYSEFKNLIERKEIKDEKNNLKYKIQILEK